MEKRNDTPRLSSARETNWQGKVWMRREGRKGERREAREEAQEGHTF